MVNDLKGKVADKMFQAYVYFNADGESIRRSIERNMIFVDSDKKENILINGKMISCRTIPVAMKMVGIGPDTVKCDGVEYCIEKVEDVVLVIYRNNVRFAICEYDRYVPCYGGAETKRLNRAYKYVNLEDLPTDYFPLAM